MLFVLHVWWYVQHEIKCGSVCSTPTIYIHTCYIHVSLNVKLSILIVWPYNNKHGGGESVAVAAGLKAKKSCKVLQLDCM